MSKHPEAPGQRPGWCIHYRSPVHGDTCSAGVRYLDLRDGDKPPLMHRSPCFTSPGEVPSDRATCDQRRLPTEREIAEYKDWHNSRFGHLIEAINLIAPWLEENIGKNATTTITCPKCGSPLHVSKVGSNDHTRGQCSGSKLCIGWIQ